MFELLAKYFSIILSSSLKFFLGPIAGSAFNLSFWETAICTAVGMMASVILFAILGHKIKVWQEKNFPRKKTLFTSKNRRIVSVWQKFGLAGVAFLTPVLLTPIGGTIIATAFGEHTRRIVLFMLPSAIGWAIVATALIDEIQALIH